MTTEIDEKEFQHAVCLYLQKKVGSTNEKEVSAIASALGVNLTSPCTFNVESLLKKNEVDEGMIIIIIIVIVIHNSILLIVHIYFRSRKKISRILCPSR